MARKGQFKKGGGRHGGGTATKSRSRKASKAIVVHHTRTVSAPKAHRRRRGAHKGSGMPRLLPLALVTAGIAYVTGDSGPAQVRAVVAKIPGVATFGAPAALGLGCLAVDRFVKPNRWLKLAGVAGLVLAAARVGTQGTNFKWVGDVSTGDYAGELDGMDDVGDDDTGDVDDVGDDD